jgi:hypothetical protein
MNLAELLLTLSVVALPVLLGAVTGFTGRPWWWAALGAIVLFVVAAIVPEPEAGEPRIAAGDVGFLVIVAVIVAGLAWLGCLIGRRLARRRSPG